MPQLTVTKIHVVKCVTWIFVLYQPEINITEIGYICMTNARASDIGKTRHFRHIEMFIKRNVIVMGTMENKNKREPGSPPKTWLLESILVTVLCCLPLGIPAIVYASKVESLFYAGLIDDAEQASHIAGRWTKIAFWVGIAFYIIIALYIFVFVRTVFLPASL